RDRNLHLGSRRIDFGLARRLAVANASQEVRDRIRHAHVVLQWFQLLPAGLSEARDFSPHGRLAQLGAAEAELAIVAARAARDLATIAQTDLARIAGQSLQLGLRRLALRRAGRRLANNLFQT